MNAATSGPLAGLRVVELASEFGAYAGRLLADMGAEVVLVEPTGGHVTRTYEPFADDRPGPENSLWFWFYNSGKKSVTLDVENPAARGLLRRLLLGADVILEADRPRRLHALGLDPDDDPELTARGIWVSITPFGRDDPRSFEPVVDLTSLAGAGPVWSCGYDDHTLPPVRGAGNQAAHMAGVWAVNSVLTAWMARERSGRGQVIDVSMHAAGNVATESATVRWIVSGQTVQRQTARHASPWPTPPTLCVAADGRWVSTGVPPRSPAVCAEILAWLTECGLVADFDDVVFLEIGSKMASIPHPEHTDDPVELAVVAAMRDALTRIAATMSGADFFRNAQHRGAAVAVMLPPEDALEDEHFRSRGFPTPVPWSGTRAEVVFPGPPFRMSRTPWRTSARAPGLGEHDDEVVPELSEAADPDTQTAIFQP